MSNPASVLATRMRGFGYTDKTDQGAFDAWLNERPARRLEWAQYQAYLDKGPRQSPFDPNSMNTPWVHSPFFGRLLAEKALSEEQAAMVRAFHEDGLVKIDLRDAICDGTAEQVIEELADKYTDPVRIQDAWRNNEDVKQIALNPKVIETLELLYGRDVVPFQTLNFRVGTEQAGHTDTVHFDSMPHRFMCGVWVGLEDIDANNGPLFYYPGSQLLPVYDFFDAGLEGSRKEEEFSPRYATYVDFLDQLMEAHGLEKQTLTVNKGEAVIWSANVIHGGSPIVEPGRSRHSQVTHYYFKGCSYYTPLLSNWHKGDVFFRDITDIRTGELVPNAYLFDDTPAPPQQRIGKRRALKVLLGLE
ncbi:phytanoyl-CoA dioxygenase family protein [Nisaea sediminum]|uniref:phytanoyl-CoA dioxygenase family protein n=1 Tax=Nisaea sediminum TaxID=2775867 RepID=UPI0018686843|nr:phytanoyl-CoA dioxygenase family protein [Nisaea sediminum]